MKILYVSYRSIVYNCSSSALGILLSSLGTAIFCLTLLLSSQLNQHLSLNSRNIDLVVGAKGSPLQLILNSIYYVDYPTGNILLQDAQEVAKHPLVKFAVPLLLGDNYQGFRIIGTDSNFLHFYHASFSSGRWIARDFESVVGYQVARDKHLKLGDKIVGAHGLASNEDLHADHPYTVVGILEKNNSVTDRLVLTNMSSVWHMHGHEHEGKRHHHESEEEEHEAGEDGHRLHDLLTVAGGGKEITSMLIRYKNPTAVAMFPRMVNQTTNMQAASPAIESARLFSIMGLGLDALHILAVVLMLMAAVSVFLSLFNSFKSRRYELAIMRTMGASRRTLFKLMMMEGVLITIIGSILGILIAHTTALVISTKGGAAFIEAWHFGLTEVTVVLVGLLLGFTAALIPAIKAYATPISRTLSE
ncbi:FtsX-like permease family protein [Olivibacter sp. XZL3]|uniref:ABC transporter permease n=1 Tax=Olivibacter sp. XZL3 TaxID=1735116 RepID=UPI00106618AB|nr:FtsX-like permease family protein [Olivibacter sp. XZL3]